TYLRHIPVTGNRWHFKNFRQSELIRSVLSVLVQHLADDGSSFGAILIEEVLLVPAELLGSFPPGGPRCGGGYVAGEVEWVGFGLACRRGQFVEVDAPLLQLLDDRRALLEVAPLLAEVLGVGVQRLDRLGGVLCDLDRPELATVGVQV